MERKKRKTVYLEILRFIAIFGVLFCHTGYNGVFHYLETDNRINYWFGIFLVSISQYCVPLFFMITGALLVKCKESLSYVLKHRVLKILIVIFGAVLLQYLWNYRRNPAIGLDGKTYLRLVYEGSATTPQWFLYTYLSLMLILPFLQRLAEIIPHKSWFLYLFLVWQLIYGFFPILEYYQEWGNSPLSLPMFADCIIFCLLGYFTECCTEDIFYKGRNVLILFGVTVLLILETMHMNYISLSEYPFARYGSLFAPVYALFIFVTVRYLCHKLHFTPVLEKVCCFVGGGVFGTYLAGEVLLQIFYPVYLWLSTRIHAYPAAFVWISICMAVGVLLSNLVKKIPGVGKLI